jgi:hypothetical protein
MKKNQEQINTYNKISNKNHYTLQKKNINKIIDEKSIKYIRQLNSNKKEIKKEKTINDNKSNKNNEENSIYENTDSIIENNIELNKNQNESNDNENLLCNDVLNKSDEKNKKKEELKVNIEENENKKKCQKSFSSPIIVNEFKKFEIPKIKNPKIKIIYLYLHEEFYLNVNPTITLSEIKFIIGLNLNLDVNKFNMIYNDKVISKEILSKKLNEYINFSKIKIRPIFIIKKRLIISNTLPIINTLYSKNYIYKVRILNYPSMANKDVLPEDNLYKIINDFFIGKMIKKDFICEKRNIDEFIISFPSSDIAFDFNRYMFIIKNMRPILRDIKTSLMINKKRKNSLNNLDNFKSHNKNNKFNTSSKMNLLWEYYKF